MTAHIATEASPGGQLALGGIADPKAVNLWRGGSRGTSIFLKETAGPRAASPGGGGS